jgi:hypothetical protein
MDVQVAVLADYANIAAGDKLNVMGIFNTIFASAFPTVHPFMVLALRLRLGYEDGGKTHDLVVSLRDEDGREYLRAAAKAKGWDVPLRYHPEHPDLNVVLFPTERVHVAVTLHVVRIIDTLATRLAQSGAHGSTSA